MVKCHTVFETVVDWMVYFSVAINSSHLDN